MFYFFNFYIRTFLSSHNSKQWLDYEHFSAHIFRNDRLELSDTISLIDMYERLIHAGIQQRQSPLYLYYQTHIRDKHEPRSIQIIRMETTRPKQQIVVKLVFW